MYVTRETQRFIYTMLAKESQDKVFCKNTIIAIFNLLQNDDLSVSMKMAYTSLLVGVIDHKIGRQWIIKNTECM
ncbi:hypothetical protein HCN44_008737 [Aphidius gifuensis]|uniref:Uncharacterized protein n=1 Tax=Aphidius gifuensis TaxID=684658 RepID=A0A834Y1N9_APHGI|nr:hypothetical protein HCN44_008737 [Aphidius gifuensis]